VDIISIEVYAGIHVEMRGHTPSCFLDSGAVRVIPLQPPINWENGVRILRKK
jgi:hypothetical protein